MSDEIDALAMGVEADQPRKRGRPSGDIQFKAAAGFLRIADVSAKIGLGRSSVYRMIEAGEFPKPVHLGARNSQWIAAEVDEWISARIAERDAR